jgi:uncharacterized membrane protein YdjX (TVP38/TMEM64 family)
MVRCGAKAGVGVAPCRACAAASTSDVEINSSVGARFIQVDSSLKHETRKLLKNGMRVAALLVVLAGIAVAVIYRSEIHPAAVRKLIAGNPFSPVIFMTLQIVASLLFVPRTVLGLAAGLLFGLVWGSLWAITGAVAGAAAGFAFVRWMGLTGALDTQPGVGRLVQKAERGGWRAVAIVRLTPLPHSVANTMLALTNLSWRDYLWGSFVGMLPMTLAQVAIGASGGEVFEGHRNWAVACFLLAVGLAGSVALQRKAARRY